MRNFFKSIQYGLQLRLNRLIGRSFIECPKEFYFEISGVCNLLCRMW